MCKWFNCFSSHPCFLFDIESFDDIARWQKFVFKIEIDRRINVYRRFALKSRCIHHARGGVQFSVFYSAEKPSGRV